MYVVTHHLDETVLMRGHNIHFHGEIRKIIYELSSVSPLTWNSAQHCEEFLYNAVVLPTDTDGVENSAYLDQEKCLLSPIQITYRAPGFEDNSKIIFLISQ